MTTFEKFQVAIAILTVIITIVTMQRIHRQMDKVTSRGDDY